jgi:glycosyltransferase involved in cell wall biosynthesis
MMGGKKTDSPVYISANRTIGLLFAPWDSADRTRSRSAVQPKALSVVVPAYNEARRLRRSLPEITDAVTSLGGELIVVDDGSEDATTPVAAEHLRGVPGARLIRLPLNCGKGAAVRAGVTRARGKAVVFMDADLATDLNDLPALLAALEHSEVAIGSRAVEGAVTEGASTARTGMGRAFNQLARMLTGLDLRDTQCGFKAFRAPAAKLLFHLGAVDGFAFDVEILTLARRIGYRISEVPVHWHAVEGSQVHMLRDPARMTRDVVMTHARWRRSKILAVVRALEGDGAVDVLRAHVRASDSVVPWGDGALALLPCGEPAAAGSVVVRLRRDEPDLRVRAGTVPVTAVLHPSSEDLRRALVPAS